MNKVIKLIIVVCLIALPIIAFAAPTNVNRLTDHIEPLIRTDYIKAPYFVASSTSATSTFAGKLLLATSTDWSFAGPLQIAGNFASLCNNCTSAGNIVSIANYGGGTTGISSFNARGTIDAPAATQAGDVLLFLGGRGHYGSAWNNGSDAAIQMVASNNYSGVFAGSYITLETADDAEISSRKERVRIAPNGNLGIGTTTPWRTLSVKGSSDLGINAIAGSFTATSTTATSAFPYASTTAISASTLYATTGNIDYIPHVTLNALTYDSLSSGALQAASGDVYIVPALGYSAGGTGLTSLPSYGQLLMGDGAFGYTLVSTSSLAINRPGEKYSVYFNPNDSSTLAGTSTLNIRNERVGVGENNPAGVLTVSASSGTVDPFMVSSNDTTDGDFFTIKNTTGNVGIGTTSPYAKLSVAGQVVADYFTATSTATSTAANGWNITSGCFAVNGTCVGGSGSGVTGGTAGMLAAFTSATALTATGTPTAAAYVATSSTATSYFAGNVGIGTTTPYVAIGNSLAVVGNQYNIGEVDIHYPSTGVTPVTITSSANGGYLTYGHLQWKSPTGAMQGLLGGTDAVGGKWGMFTLYGDSSTGDTRLGEWDVADDSASGDKRKAGITIDKSPSGTGWGFHIFTSSFKYNMFADPNGGSAFGETFANGQTPPENGIIVQTKIGVGTTTPGTILSLGNTGSDTINISTTATSTFGSGIDIRTGCFAVNGTCVGGGSGSGTVNSGTTGQIPYYAANGSTLSATSSLFVSSTGNIGIGTTSPYAKLSVAGEVVADYFTSTSTTATSTFPLFEAGDNNKGLFVMANGRVAISQSNTAAGIQNRFDSTATMPLTVNNGFVVQYSDNNSDWFRVEGGNVSFNVAGGTTLIGNTNDQGARVNVGLRNTTSKGVAVYGVSGVPDYMHMFEASSLTGRGGDLFNVTAGGNVGIGTTTPYVKMTIASSNATTSKPLFLIASSSPSISTTTYMIVDGLGNVGIGTTSPSSTLEVWGSQGCKTVATTTTTTLTSTDCVVYVPSWVTSSFTINLPTVSNLVRTYTVKNRGTGVITLDGASSEPIDGTTTFELAENESVEIISTASTTQGWIIK
jgi:hypothetical protein